VDEDIATSLTQLQANWAASSDVESGIADYLVAVGTTPGVADIYNWTSAGAATSTTITGLSLTASTTYYISVKAVNGAGLQSAATTSDGITVTDSTPPTSISNINDGTGTDTSVSTSLTTLSANWSDSSDTETGITQYWYCIGTSLGLCDVVNWTSAGTATSTTITGLTLVEGTTYYVNVKAENGIGLFSDIATTDGVTVDTGNPVLVITSPAAGATISGTNSIIGTISDPTLTGWSLSYGPGTTPATWKDIASGTTEIASATIGTWDASTLNGPYVLRLTATDLVGNTTQATASVTISNTVTISGTVPMHKWVLMSIPVNPPGPNDPISLFGNGEYKVYNWDETLPYQQYQAKFYYPTSLSAGDGIWIKSYDNDLPYSYTGSLNDTTQDYIIPAQNGWTIIGTPFNRAFPWGNAGVRHNGSTYAMTTAASLGLISTTVYGYDETLKTWVQYTAADNLEVQKGYYFRAYDNVDLVMGPGAGIPGGVARRVRPVYDYRIKLSASAGEVADRDNHVGASNLGDARYDVLDSEKPPASPEGNYISLYFPHTDWDKRSGRYANDVRAMARTMGHTETWDFSVETTVTGQTATLEWDAATLPAELFQFTLVNLDTGERIDMTKQGSYTYPVAAGDVATAHFRIEVVKLQQTAVTSTITLQPGWNLISVPLEPEVTNAITLLGQKLPLFNVYQYYDGQFYENDKADIQAGFGYWVYVENNAQIDLTGMPAAPQVRVPLKPGWNVIGNPYETDLPWNDTITLDCGGQSPTLSQAIQTKAIDAHRYQFDGENYLLVEQSAPMQPWKGYFIKATQECEMVLTQ